MIDVSKITFRLVVTLAAALGLVACSGGDDGGSGGAPAGFAGSGSPVAGNGTAGTPSMVAGSGAPSGVAGSTAGAGTAGDNAAGMAGMDTVAGMGGMAGMDTVAGMGGTAGMDTVAGMGGTAGMDTEAGTGGDTVDPPTDLGEGDGSDVIMIGDSYMNLSVGSGTQWSINNKIAPRMYRAYAVPGTQVLNGQIPSQYTQAKGANPDIKTVIMTAGGNDVILDFFGNLLACQGAAHEADLSQACITALTEITAGVDKMFQQMGADGVQDVVYIGYGYVTNNELGGTIEWVRSKRSADCNGEMTQWGVRCHFIDPAEQLIGMIGGDGIHPTVAGYNMIADMVLEKLEAAGIRR